MPHILHASSNIAHGPGPMARMAARQASLGVTMHSAMVALPATGGIPLLEMLLLIGGALLLGMGVLLYALLRRRV